MLTPEPATVRELRSTELEGSLVVIGRPIRDVLLEFVRVFDLTVFRSVTFRRVIVLPIRLRSELRVDAED